MLDVETVQQTGVVDDGWIIYKISGEGKEGRVVISNNQSTHTQHITLQKLTFQGKAAAMPDAAASCHPTTGSPFCYR